MAMFLNVGRVVSTEIPNQFNWFPLYCLRRLITYYSRELYFIMLVPNVRCKFEIYMPISYTELINDNLFLNDSCTFYIQFTDNISNLETQT